MTPYSRGGEALVTTQITANRARQDTNLYKIAFLIPEQKIQF